MFIGENDNQIQHVQKVIILVDRVQIVEQGLEFIVLHATVLGDKLFDIEQNVATQCAQVLHTRPFGLVQGFWHVSTASRRVDDPIVVLERVHHLYYGTYASYIVVDVDVVDKLGGYVRKQFDLHVHFAINPYGRIE